MKHISKIFAALMVLMFMFSWYPVLKSEIPVNNETTKKSIDNHPTAWSWADMDVTSIPPLPGLGGTDNPDHLQMIRITVTAKNSKTIDRAEFNFSAVAWDPSITQKGLFYMNSSSGKTPDATWYIELGVGYFYIDPVTGEKQEDSYDTKLLVTAGTKVIWNLNCFSKTESPSYISSPSYNYTVEGAWYRQGSTDTELFNNNLDVTFSPKNPMMNDKVTVTISVKTALPPGHKVKPIIYQARVHVSFMFYDANQKDISDMQIDALPLQPDMRYTKTATIIKAWHYKPHISVSFWCEAWQESSKRYWHVTSYPFMWHYQVSEAGLWKYPPPKGTFDQNIAISVKPNVIQNPDAAITKDATGKLNPGCGNVTVTVESRFTDVPLHPATRNLSNPYLFSDGTKLMYTVTYDDGFGLVNETGKPKYYTILPTLTNSTTKLVMVIPAMQQRLAAGHVMFYVEAWNITRQRAGVLYTDAHPNSPDTVGPDDPYIYNIQPAANPPGSIYTSFVVWVYDDRFDMKYIPHVNVTFKNGTNLDVPISQTQTNSMGWCYPTKPDGSEPLFLKLGDAVLIEVNYYMPLGGTSAKKQLIKANYTYKIELGTCFKNTTVPKQYNPISNIRTSYRYYVVVSEMPNMTANIFFKFNWKPTEPVPIYANIQSFDNEFLAVGTGTIASVVTLVPVVWMLDKRRKKAEEEEKRVTL